MVDPKSKLTRLLRKHCSALAVRFEAPYIVSTERGERLAFCGYLPDFGGENGVLIEVGHPVSEEGKATGTMAYAKVRGFYYSQVNPESWETLAGCVEALADWGYYGKRELFPPGLQDAGVYRHDR